MTVSSIRVRSALRLVSLLAVLGSASGAYALSPAREPATVAAVSHLDYDQLTAHVPRELAPIASVAVTRVNIAMHQAKQLTEQRLCAGQWTPQGSIRLEVGPGMTPPMAGDTPGHWLYQSFRQPEALSCNGVSRAHFFQELSRHLPDWIMIRPGGQTTAFQRGFPVAANQGP